MAAVKKVDAFGPSLKGSFPEEMRKQVWPLCCGFGIISGFKNTQEMTEKELTESINYVCDVPRPDFQVYAYEQINPRTTFLTLNGQQLESPKVMKAVAAAGFVEIGRGKPRGRPQALFIRDKSKTWKQAPQPKFID